MKINVKLCKTRCKYWRGKSYKEENFLTETQRCEHEELCSQTASLGCLKQNNTKQASSQLSIQCHTETAVDSVLYLRSASLGESSWRLFQNLFQVVFQPFKLKAYILSSHWQAWLCTGKLPFLPLQEVKSVIEWYQWSINSQWQTEISEA